MSRGDSCGQENLDYPDLGSHPEIPVLAKQVEFSEQTSPSPPAYTNRSSESQPIDSGFAARSPDSSL